MALGATSHTTNHLVRKFIYQLFQCIMHNVYSPINTVCLTYNKPNGVSMAFDLRIVFIMQYAVCSMDGCLIDGLVGGG